MSDEKPTLDGDRDLTGMTMNEIMDALDEQVDEMYKAGSPSMTEKDKEFTRKLHQLMRDHAGDMKFLNPVAAFAVTTALAAVGGYASAARKELERQRNGEDQDPALAVLLDMLNTGGPAN